MQTRNFLSRARRGLALRGVVGKRATTLLEEWNDHLESGVESLVASGQQHDEAYLHACAALGEPETLADRAATELARGTWGGRHPWLSSGIIGMLLVLTSLAAMLMGGFVLIETEIWEHLPPGSVQNLVAWIGAVPWILGLIWLASHTRRMPAGWKGFWIVAGFAGLILNLPKFFFLPPYNGPLTGSLGFGFGFNPAGDGLKLVITIGLAALFWWRATRFQGIRSIGKIAIFAAAFCLPGCALSQRVEAVREAVDAGRVQGMSDETRLIYSIPNSHKGPYSKVERYNLSAMNPDKPASNTTFFLGKSRQTGEWEVIAVAMQGNDTGLRWKSVPVHQEE